MTPSVQNRRLRQWVLVIASASLLAVTACGGDASSSATDRAATMGVEPQVATTPPPDETPDPAEAARAEAQQLAKGGKYAAASGKLAAAGLDDQAARMERRGARALLRSARGALAKHRYTRAKSLVTQSRALRKTSASRTVLASANAGIEQEAAAKRERVRLARIARDQRTCSSAEKRTVRDGLGTPAGCTTYAVDYAAKQAAKAEEAPEDGGDCDPNYAGACLKPDSSDYDCEGGSGDGPDYTGPVQVVGSDPYDLDRDGDGSACET
jgi:hypothetical protein